MTRELPCFTVIPHQAAEEAGKIAGCGIDPHRSEIDDAGDLIAGEEDVVVPEVADDGKHWDAYRTRFVQLQSCQRCAATKMREQASSASLQRLAGMTVDRRSDLVRFASHESLQLIAPGMDREGLLKSAWVLRLGNSMDPSDHLHRAR